MKQRKRLERVEEHALTEAVGQGRARHAVLQDSIQRRALSLSPANFEGSIVDLAARMSGRRYVERTDRMIAAQRSALEHSNREIDEARERLLERRRDRLALEALLDRAVREEARLRERREALHLDEVGASSWFRSSGAGKGT